MSRGNLKGDLTALLNGFSLENSSNTPDFILAQYLLSCLEAYNVAVTNRANWYGRMDAPGRGSLPFSKARKLVTEITDDERDEVHYYISTACQHGRHDECRKVCKFCSGTCLCVYCDHPVVEKTDES